MKATHLWGLALLGLVGIGLACPVMASGAVGGDEPAIQVSPHVINLTRVSDITVHTNLPAAAVEADTVRLNGVVPTSVWADDRGDLAARFALADLALAAGEAPLTLTGLCTDGSAFSATEVVRAIPGAGSSPGGRGRQGFPSVVGGWDLTGTIRYNYKVATCRGIVSEDLEEFTAAFDDDGTFYLAWYADAETAIRLVGGFRQKNRKVTAVEFASDYLQSLVLDTVRAAGIEPDEVSDGPAKVNITVLSADALRGEVQIQYLVTTATGQRGKVLIKLAFTGRAQSGD